MGTVQEKRRRLFCAKGSNWEYTFRVKPNNVPCILSTRRLLFGTKVKSKNKLFVEVYVLNIILRKNDFEEF